MADPLRHFADGLASLGNPVGSPVDKVLVGLFRWAGWGVRVRGCRGAWLSAVSRGRVLVGLCRRVGVGRAALGGRDSVAQRLKLVRVDSCRMMRAEPTEVMDQRWQANGHQRINKHMRRVPEGAA